MRALVTAICACAGLGSATVAEDMSDVVTVPPRFVSDFRRWFPAAVVDDPECHSEETATSCKIDFKILSSSGRTLLGGCSTLFYAKVGNGVFEDALCSAVGPADGTLTVAEHADLSAMRTRIIAVLVGRTAERLSPAEQGALTARINEVGSAHQDGWSYDISEEGNIMGADACRGFEAVKAEFDRRFGGTRWWPF